MSPKAPTPGRWPTLGLDVVEWIETYCVHGPGDVRGRPVQLTPEVRRFVCRAYQLHGRRASRAGRRRFARAVYSRIKGTAKSEIAAFLVLAELLGPVRFDGWDRDGFPVGRPVESPYIPVAATSEEQAEDTLWGAVYAIASEGPLADDLDIGVDRIIDPSTGGETKVVTSSSIARDGGKPTFTAEDETHLYVLAELQKLDGVLRRNLAKRPLADPWGLATTTMFRRGEHSVAETDYDLHEAGTPWLLYDHREAGPQFDITTDEGLIAAIEDARGDADWLDPVPIANDYRRDPYDGERYWLNRRSASRNAAFDIDRWDLRAVGSIMPKARQPVTLGFDGSLSDDSTALSAALIEPGYLWMPRLWERPETARPGDWDVKRDELAAIESALEEMFDTYRVVRAYFDPHWWHDEVSRWTGRYGRKIVIPFDTTKDSRMVVACARFDGDVNEGALQHPEDPRLRKHIENARRRETRVRLDDGRMGWTIQKERPDSPNKIDAAMSSLLAWEARGDAIAAGVKGRAARAQGF